MTEPTPFVLYEVQQAVAVITLNRPERLNALSGPVMDQLYERVAQPATDGNVRAVLLRGAGRGFCAGGDVKSGSNSKPDTASMTNEVRIAQLRRRSESAHLMHTMNKPTVSALRGPVMGAGVGLGLSADFRLASDTLKLRTAFVDLAFSGDFGTTYFLTRLAGTSVARQLMIRSDPVDSGSALELGLVSRVVSDESLDFEALQFAHQLAAGPTVAIAAIKRSLVAAANGFGLSAILDLEADSMVQTSLTEDHREAVEAFVAKRSPQFLGR